MKLKTKDFKENNYFVLYPYDYLGFLDCEDQVLAYYDNWEELHKKILKNLRVHDLVYEYNRNKSNMINIIYKNRKYILATFNDNDEELK